MYIFIREKLDELPKAQDLSPYIELAETVQYLKNGVSQYGAFKRMLYIEFFNFVNRPNIFRDIDKLKRANELHVQLLVDINFSYRRYEDKTDRE